MLAHAYDSHGEIRDESVSVLLDAIRTSKRIINIRNDYEKYNTYIYIRTNTNLMTSICCVDGETRFIRCRLPRGVFVRTTRFVRSRSKRRTDEPRQNEMCYGRRERTGGLAVPNFAKW